MSLQGATSSLDVTSPSQPQIPSRGPQGFSTKQRLRKAGAGTQGILGSVVGRERES